MKGLLERTLLRTGVILLGSYLVICGVLWERQAHFIFFPYPDVIETPAAYGASFENVRIPIDHAMLAGWWIPSTSGNPKVLLYMHGNGGNIGSNVDQAVRLSKIGPSVLIFDYRGYGNSSGPFPSEKRVYQDSEAAWQYLVGTRKVNPKDIFIYGHSLGSAIAIELAIHHPEAGGLISESGFTSVLDMAGNGGTLQMFPVRLILSEHFDSLSKLQRLKIPVLFIHGMSDHVVLPSMAKTLFDASPPPKQLVLIPGGDHEDNAIVGGSLYAEAIRKFVK